MSVSLVLVCVIVGRYGQCVCVTVRFVRAGLTNKKIVVFVFLFFPLKGKGRRMR